MPLQPKMRDRSLIPQSSGGELQFHGKSFYGVGTILITSGCLRASRRLWPSGRDIPVCFLIGRRPNPSCPGGQHQALVERPCSIPSRGGDHGRRRTDKAPRESPDGALPPRRMQVGQHNKLPTTILLNLQGPAENNSGPMQAAQAPLDASSAAHRTGFAGNAPAAATKALPATTTCFPTLLFHYLQLAAARVTVSAGERPSCRETRPRAVPAPPRARAAASLAQRALLASASVCLLSARGCVLCAEP
jgi:hypothetical protein